MNPTYFEPLAEAESALISAGWQCIAGRTMMLWRNEKLYPSAVFTMAEAIQQVQRSSK